MMTTHLADEALQRLFEGNQRYANNAAVHPNATASRRAEVVQGQKPLAMILGCVDSRVPPEIIFDCGLGDLFVIRTAGQVIDKAVLGSIEFGADELHIPLLVVLGHEQCGAVKATIEIMEQHASAEGDIRTLIQSIRPAVEEARYKAGELVEEAVRINIEMTINRLKHSPILAAALHKNELKIVGAYYALETGVVEISAP